MRYVLALAVLVAAQWGWTAARRPAEGGLFYLWTRPSGAAVSLLWVDESGFRPLPLGRTPGPLSLGPAQMPGTVRLQLFGFEDRELKLDRPASFPARYPTSGELELVPAWPGAGLLYLLRDWPFVFAIGLLGLAALGRWQRGARARAEQERLRRLFERGEVRPGVQVGGYVLGERIGRGGMAAVYRARRVGEPEGEVLALKLLDASLARDERWRNEVDVARGLAHPHIVALLDWGEFGGRVYLVMEYVQGETLADRLAAGRPAQEDAVRWCRQAAEALAFAHARGIAHRDVKPSNLMLAAPRDSVKLMDFGLARRVALQEADRGVGSPGYAAPEERKGVEADLYGLGCVLYEMLAGRPAFRGETAMEVLLRQRSEDPEPLTDVPPALAALVQRLMARDPAARGTAQDVLEALPRESTVSSDA